MSMHSLITALRTGSSHAAVSIRDLCQDPEAVPQLLREGGVGALIAAAAPSNPPKIRGWSLSALAILARSENPSAHRALPEALSTLLSSLHSSPPECRAWAAEAMAGICRHADSSSALAVRLGAVPHLLDSLRLARASTAGEAVARSALGALAAIVRVSAGRAQLLGEADGVECFVSLLLIPTLAAAAAEVAHELCMHGGGTPARQVLLCASLPAALPLLTCPSDDQGHSPLCPTRVVLRAATAPFLTRSPASVPPAVRHCNAPQTAALRLLRAAARDLIARSTGVDAAPAAAALDELISAVDRLLALTLSESEGPFLAASRVASREPLAALSSPNAEQRSRAQVAMKANGRVALPVGGAASRSVNGATRPSVPSSPIGARAPTHSSASSTAVDRASPKATPKTNTDRPAVRATRAYDVTEREAGREDEAGVGDEMDRLRSSLRAQRSATSRRLSGVAERGTTGQLEGQLAAIGAAEVVRLEAALRASEEAHAAEVAGREADRMEGDVALAQATHVRSFQLADCLLPPTICWLAAHSILLPPATCSILPTTTCYLLPTSYYKLTACHTLLLPAHHLLLSADSLLTTSTYVYCNYLVHCHHVVHCHY